MRSTSTSSTHQPLDCDSNRPAPRPDSTRLASHCVLAPPTTTTHRLQPRTASTAYRVHAMHHYGETCRRIYIANFSSSASLAIAPPRRSTCATLRRRTRLDPSRSPALFLRPPRHQPASSLVPLERAPSRRLRACVPPACQRLAGDVEVVRREQFMHARFRSLCAGRVSGQELHCRPFWTRRAGSSHDRPAEGARPLLSAIRPRRGRVEGLPARPRLSRPPSTAHSSAQCRLEV